MTDRATIILLALGFAFIAYGAFAEDKGQEVPLYLRAPVSNEAPVTEEAPFVQMKSLKKKRVSSFLKSGRFIPLSPVSILREALWKAKAQFYWGKEQADYRMLVSERIYLKIDHTFPGFFHLDNQWILTGAQGSTQALYVRRGTGDGITMRSLNAGWRGIPDLDIRAGIFYMDSIAGYGSYKKSPALARFYQSFFEAPLLIADWSFIGLTQKYSGLSPFLSPWVKDSFILSRQSIPSGETALDRFSQVQNLPSLLTASFFAGDVQLPALRVNEFDLSSLNNRFFIAGSMTGFLYRNLSARAAEEGRTLGNTSKDIYLGGDSELKYSFYGIYTSGGVYFDLFDDLNIELKTAFLWNFGAPRGRNKAQSVSVAVTMPVGASMFLSPSLEYFVNQSDASVAYYNSRKYGYSGHKGFLLGFRLNLEQHKAFVRLQLGSVRSMAKGASPIGYSNYLEFSLGTDYARI